MRYVISGVLKQSRQAWSGSQLPQLIKHLVLARPAGRMEVISGGCLLGGQLTPVQGYFRKKKNGGLVRDLNSWRGTPLRLVNR